MEKVYLVIVKFYRGDGINLKQWEEIKGIFTSIDKAEKFIEDINLRYEIAEFLIKETELNVELTYLYKWNNQKEKLY